MTKAYVLIYNDTVGTREEIKEWADKSPHVQTWRYDLPNCFYLISDASAQEVDEDFENYFGKKGRYLILEATANRQGLLPMDTWYLLTHKKHKER
jgi:hypothetical protein